MNAPIPTLIPHKPFLTRGAEGLDRRGFTVDEIWKMIEAGLLRADEHFELIDGEIVPMAPESTRHVAIKSRLAKHLTRAIGADWLVVVDSTLYLSDSTFVEPDIYVALDQVEIATTPGPDLALVCEVSASSQGYDYGIKADLYARFGVREYWAVAADTLSTRVFRVPGAGGYQEVFDVPREETLSAQFLEPYRISMSALV
jgi:Uma2 family endonuclease